MSTTHKHHMKKKSRRGFWLYLIPGGIGFTIIILIPFFSNLYYSMTKWKGGASKKRWVGFDNYVS
ncbi:sugar ABC transporter permease, partial [Actinotignum timonense]|nr:sugar ABC transporter permease [Actinotignum timonense]